MGHRYLDLKVNGYKKSMVEQQLRELRKKDKDRKLESKARNKKWYDQFRKESKVIKK